MRSVNFLLIIGLIGLFVNWVVSTWDDGMKLFDRAQWKWPLVVKVGLGIVALCMTIGGVIMSDRASDDQKLELMGKLDSASNSVRSISTQLSNLSEKYENLLITNSLNETLAKQVGYELVVSKLNTAKEKNRLFREINTEKFNLAFARESLSNKWEMQRLEALKARMEDEREKPAKRLAEETAKREQEDIVRRSLEATLDQYLGYCDYTLTSLQNILQDRAKDRGNSTKLRWDCQDAAKLLESNGTCEFRGEDPSEDVYLIAVSGFHQSTPAIHVRITCMGGSIAAKDKNTPRAPARYTFTNSLNITFSERHGKVLGDLELLDSSGLKSYRAVTNTASYKKEVYTMLGELVAAQP